jgi:hypothetical protein
VVCSSLFAWTATKGALGGEAWAVVMVVLAAGGAAMGVQIERAWRARYA